MKNQSSPLPGLDLLTIGGNLWGASTLPISRQTTEVDRPTCSLRHTGGLRVNVQVSLPRVARAGAAHTPIYNLEVTGIYP